MLRLLRAAKTGITRHGDIKLADNIFLLLLFSSPFSVSGSAVLLPLQLWQSCSCQLHPSLSRIYSYRVTHVTQPPAPSVHVSKLLLLPIVTSRVLTRRNVAINDSRRDARVSAAEVCARGFRSQCGVSFPLEPLHRVTLGCVFVLSRLFLSGYWISQGSVACSVLSSEHN